MEKQTTDGDTAQVGPAIAEHLGIPHAAWVSEIVDADSKSIQVKQDLVSVSQTSKIPYPCLITVDKDMCVPRLPSYLLQKQSKDRPVKIMTFEDMADQNLSKIWTCRITNRSRENVCTARSRKAGLF